jgi:hypothetical protein
MSNEMWGSRLDDRFHGGGGHDSRRRRPRFAADAAVAALFGAPSPRTLAAYDEAHPRADGHAERVELYQLLPLLVHAVLFGGGYGDSVTRAARRYA